MNIYSKVMRKHGKSFFWASWFLDKNTANKLYAVYALCRRLDDLVDTSNKNSEAYEEIAKIISLSNNTQYNEIFEESFAYNNLAALHSVCVITCTQQQSSRSSR